jgi:hypothetical protein
MRIPWKENEKTDEISRISVEPLTMSTRRRIPDFVGYKDVRFFQRGRIHDLGVYKCQRMYCLEIPVVVPLSHDNSDCPRNTS